MSVTILARCRDYVAAVKPYGLLSEGEGEDAFPRLLREELGVETVYTVHRLDRTTEGVMVYALTKNGAAELSRIVAAGEMDKRYTAYITPDPSLPPSGEMRDWLFFDRRRDKSFVADSGRRGAREAVLTYRLGEPFSLKDRTVVPAFVKLETGRTHQIRVQFGSRKSPLIGDGKYGSRLNHKGPALFCTSLTFPWNGETVTVELGEENPAGIV